MNANKIVSYALLLCLGLAVCCALFYRWDRNEWRAAYSTLEQQAQTTESLWMRALADHRALQVQHGALVTELATWKDRTPEDREVIRERRVSVPADCQKCIENYELDKRYSNPAVDKVPAKVIVVDIADVLGADKATWSINVPKLCPTCPPALAPAPSSKPGVEKLFKLEVGAGYGLVGPQGELGLYPLSLRGDKYDVDLGAWGSGFINQNGEAYGNVVLGVRFSRKGSWSPKLP